MDYVVLLNTWEPLMVNSSSYDARQYTINNLFYLDPVVFLAKKKIAYA